MFLYGKNKLFDYTDVSFIFEKIFTKQYLRCLVLTCPILVSLPLRDGPKNGCEGDYILVGFNPFILAIVTPSDNVQSLFDSCFLSFYFYSFV